MMNQKKKKKINIQKQTLNIISNVININKLLNNLAKFLIKDHIISALIVNIKDKKMKIVAIWYVVIAHRIGVTFVTKKQKRMM